MQGKDGLSVNDELHSELREEFVEKCYTFTRVIDCIRSKKWGYSPSVIYSHWHSHDMQPPEFVWTSLHAGERLSTSAVVWHLQPLFHDSSMQASKSTATILSLHL